MARAFPIRTPPSRSPSGASRYPRPLSLSTSRDLQASIFFFFIFFPNFIRLASSAFRSETFRIRKLGFLEIGEGIEIAMERKKYPIRAEDYQLFEMIGQGVSASVHRARCIPLAEVVAIKILDFERHNSDLVSSSCRDLALNLICFWLFVDMELG